MSAGLRWLIHATGMRFLVRRKAAFAAATLTIALAVAANTAAFSVVKAFLLSGLGVPEPDRLMLIANMRAMPGRGRVLFNDAYRNYELIRDTQRAFADVATTFQSTAIAAIGCYGVMSQLVASRYREYAVRLALGATPRGLGFSVLTRVAVLAVPGAALGSAVAVLCGGFLRRFVFGVDQRSPAVLVTVTALMLVIALLSTLAPALRAARLDPRASTSGE